MTKQNIMHNILHIVPADNREHSLSVCCTCSPKIEVCEKGGVLITHIPGQPICLIDEWKVLTEQPTTPQQ